MVGSTSSLSEQAASQIMDMILVERRFKTGDKLPNEMELAEELGISRQGVHDALVRTEAALRMMEQRLGCVGRAKTLQRAYTDLAAIAEDLRAAGRDDFADRLLAAADLIKE